MGDVRAAELRMEVMKHNSGRLTAVIGCMFSGKTTELLRRVVAARAETGDADAVQVFKHATDDRYRRDAVVTHGGEMMSAQVVSGAREIGVRVFAAFASDEDPPQSPLVKEGGGNSSQSLPGKGGGKRLVAIDEAHFFGVDLSGVVEEVRAVGIDVIVTALDRGSWGQRFPVVDRLLERTDERVSLFAVCACCGGIADRTQRLTPIVDGRLVGGPEAYEPRCANCWHGPVGEDEECRMAKSE